MVDDGRTSGLSDRAEQVLDDSNVAPYIVEHLARLADEPDPEDYLCLAVAENRIMWDLLSEKVDAARDVPPSAFTYDAMHGSEPFRTAVADVLSERLFHHRVDPSQVVGMAGAGSVLEFLVWALVEPRRGVLIPTPSYAGYWNDIQSRVGGVAVPAHTSAHDDFRIRPDHLTASARASDVEIGALLLTNPSNPLGRSLDTDEIEDAVDWARTRGVSVIMNEVYGLSRLRNSSFRSAAEILGGFSNDIHHVWAASKDLAASGLRAGILVTTDDDLLTVAAEHQYFQAISGDTQHLLTTMLDDEAWLDRYFDELTDRLTAVCGSTTDLLDDHGIGYVEPDGGIFVLADLRPWLDAPTWDAEDRLWREILDEAGVNLTPGSACRVVEPGFMRICYANADPDDVAAAVSRAVAVVTGR